MPADNTKNKQARARNSVAFAANANDHAGSAPGSTLNLAVELAPPASVEAQLAALGASPEQRAKLAELAERILAHVLRVIDRPALYGIEQCVWSELDRLEVPDEMGDLATALLAEALFQVAHCAERNIQTIPPGISPDEVIAAEYDDTCLMCRAEAADMEYRRSGRRCEDLARDAEDKEWVGFQQQAAANWRAENAAALRRFKLA